jgi:hypothetical protein
MITIPDRIGDAISALERGEQVDWRKLADLQALDLVRAGRKFVEEAIARDEAATDTLEQSAGGTP